MIAAAEHSVGHTCSRGLAALAVLCAISGPARATGLSDLEEGLPLEVRDAFAIGLYGSELQLQGGYERTRKDENRYILFPRLELGIVPNGQILVGAPFFLGGADDAGSGNVTAEAFYNFNMEGLVVPAVAVAAEFEFPTGEDAEGVDSTYALILTKTVIPAIFARVHANVFWHHNEKRQPGERQEYWGIIGGYSMRLSTAWYLLADFIYDQEGEKGREHYLAELGVRIQVTPYTVLGIGGGYGFNDDAIYARGILSLQQSFGAPFVP